METGNKVLFGDLIVSIKTGLNPRQNFSINTPTANCAYISVKDLDNLRLSNILNSNTIKYNNYVDKEIRDRINEKTNLEKGDILISGFFSTFKPVIIQNNVDNMAISENVFAIKLKEGVCKEYIASILDSDIVRKQIQQKMPNTTVMNITAKILSNLLIPLPTFEKQVEIVKKLQKLEEMQLYSQIALELQIKQTEYYKNKLLKEII